MSTTGFALPDGSLPYVCDLPPIASLAPTTPEDAVDMVRHAVSTATAIVPAGRGSRITEPNAMRGVPWQRISTAGLSRILDYSPDDMTVVVQPGATVAAVQAALRVGRQFVALDAGHSQTDTVGGIVAANAQGWAQCAHGLPRDQVLGLRAALSSGDLVRFGGNTVKNVAGYDMCKLLCGSFGTLGLLTEVTLRTRPLPIAEERICLAADDLGAALRCGLALHRAMLLPTGLAAFAVPGAAIFCEFAGTRETVAWQVGEARRIASECGVTRDCPTPDAAVIHDLGASTPLGAMVLRAAATASTLEPICAALQPWLLRTVCHIAIGVAESELNPNAPPDLVERAVVAAGCRHIRWRRLPLQVRAAHDAWGRHALGLPLMRMVKSALDPTGLFSPGRFAGRI